MATAYKNPEEATAALTAAASEDGSLSASDKAAVSNAAALVPGASAAPVVPPIQRTIDPAADAATKYLDSFKAPETADQIAERMRQGSQGAIDAINKTFDDQVSANNVIGQERLAQDNAISVLSGLTGSTEAGRTRGATLDRNDKETQAINNERLLKLQSLYTQVSQDARDEALKQREDATADANAIVTRRKEAQGADARFHQGHRGRRPGRFRQLQEQPAERGRVPARARRDGRLGAGIARRLRRQPPAGPARRHPYPRRRPFHTGVPEPADRQDQL
jgi:hypothetical protein